MDEFDTVYCHDCGLYHGCGECISGCICGEHEPFATEDYVTVSQTGAWQMGDE